MPENMRPREKLLQQGESSLSDAELLAIILGQGIVGKTALDIANHVLINHEGRLRYLMEATVDELTKEPGIGEAKAVTIKAAVEIGRRISIGQQHKITIKSPEDVKNAFMEDMRFLDRERFRVLYLDRKNGIILWEDVSVGGLHSSIVHPREVFKTAVKNSAASIILIHNHPSGDPTPSKEDVETTKGLIEAGKIMGINVLDHIIIGYDSYCSLKNKGLI
ncbi:MAG: DNA repair protein RadC [Syntrophomonadaceae bacterium]|nr:DNA repair protein RadC [Syntrophomonadaceae bacterium]